MLKNLKEVYVKSLIIIVVNEPISKQIKRYYKDLNDKYKINDKLLLIDIFPLVAFLFKIASMAINSADEVLEGTGNSVYISRYPKTYIDGIIKAYETHKMVNGRFVLDNGGQTILVKMKYCF